MAKAGALNRIILWTGSILIVYVLLISGLHKYTWKLNGVELSEDLYFKMDRYYVQAIDRVVSAATSFVRAHQGLRDFHVPDIDPRLVKKVVGGCELILGFQWFTFAWKTAAWLTALMFVNWLVVASVGMAGQSEISFACVWLFLTLLLLWLGSEPRPSRQKAPRKAPAAAPAAPEKTKAS